MNRGSKEQAWRGNEPIKHEQNKREGGMETERNRS